MPPIGRYRLPIVLQMCQWRPEGWYPADIRANVKDMEAGHRVEIPESSVRSAFDALVRDGIAVGGPPFQLAAWKFKGGESPPVVIDAAAARKVVELFRGARGTPLGDKFWALFTCSAFHHALWQFTPWGFERGAHLMVRAIRSLLAEERSFQSAEEFAGSLRSGALAFLDNLKGPDTGEEMPFGAKHFTLGSTGGKISGRELETTLEELAARIARFLSTDGYASLAGYLASPDPSRPWPSRPLELFLPNEQPLRGLGAAIQFAAMSSPTLHAWSYDLSPFPPLGELRPAELGGFPFGPTTAEGRVVARLATVLALVLHGDRAPWPVMETSLRTLDPEYEFSERTAEGWRDVHVHLAGTELTVRLPSPSSGQRNVPL